MPIQMALSSLVTERLYTRVCNVHSSVGPSACSRWSFDDISQLLVMV